MSGAPGLTGSEPRQPLLELRGLTKRFGSFTANDAVDLTLEPGEIHAILGENGAGKSTLMKLIYGVLAPDAGSIFWRGEPTAIRNPSHARALGIGMVFQHFSLFETLTVEENIALAIEQKRSGLRQRIVDVGEEFGLPVDPDALVISLSMGQRQRVEIIRCLLQDPKLIIMDEPTSVLPPSAIPALFETIRRLASKGSAVLFISHKLDEIRSLCHRATIMRAARVVATVDPTVESAQSLTKLMIGRDIPPPRRTSAQVATSAILGVSGLTTRPEDPFETALTDITLEVRPGEIVGIAGISGNGQRQLAAVLSGETPLPASQKNAVRIGQTPVGDLNSAHRRALGLAFVPEDRSGTGSVPDMDLEQNALLTGHSKGLVRRQIIQRDKLGAFTDQIILQMDVRSRGRHSLGRSLSGGNLQKFIVGRELALCPKILIAAQPTWGVDVGAAFAIRQKLVDLRDEGVGILLISDELEELLDISDRLHVLFRGRLSPSIPRREATDTIIGAWMTGEFGDVQVASAEETFP
jgi:simple sugar transport system ATP-binding protein